MPCSLLCRGLCHTIFKDKSVTTADSRIIRKDRNDLSKPGAQRRVELLFAQPQDCFIIEGRKLSKNKVRAGGIKTYGKRREK